MIFNILIGILGLGIIIFIHEAGHFISAKIFRIHVEAFALGWGKKLLGWKKNNTEYRVNIIPIGGYCRMKGEIEFRSAIESKSDSFPYSEGSLFSVSPLKRLITYAAGPIFNFLFAIILFAGIISIGYSYKTMGNRIILTSDYPEIFSAKEISPAEKAGLKTGDIIQSINGVTINYFSDLQDSLLFLADTQVPITVLRNSELLTFSITPKLDPTSGSGIIGISPWVDPVISYVEENSLAQFAGFKEGDIFTQIDSNEISNSLDLIRAFSQHARSYNCTVMRAGQEIKILYTPDRDEQGNPILSFALTYITVTTPPVGFFESFQKGFFEMFNTLTLSLKSFTLLFKGLPITEAIGGPIKLTYLMGSATQSSFQDNFKTGITTLMRILAFISIALGFTNLLPIPALDGGQILFSFAEIIRRKTFSPKNYYRVQVIGFSIIMFLLAITILSDIVFLFT